MKIFYLGLLWIGGTVLSCQNQNETVPLTNTREQDSLELIQMVADRETAMIQKDMALAMGRFTEDATWINSQGYYFEGKEELEKFHGMMMGNDSLAYYYEIGKPKIRLLDSQNALAYYSWKMFWHKKEVPSDTTFKEIGLMTLNAHKEKEGWKWTAVTNQHTPWFYPEITPVTVD